MNSNRIQIIQGGQYGSEAKGTIAGYLITKEKIDYAVRTGATNAGHTVEYNGERYAMQQLPVGWVRPKTTLVLGAGALIDLAILEREVEMVKTATGADPRQRLIVDPNAYIHRADAASRSKTSDRHHLIGATGKGCSEALIDRIRLRGKENLTIGAALRNSESRTPLEKLLYGATIADTSMLLNRHFDGGASIQLEGTQGTGLDLCYGPYPYTTHKQTLPAQWMTEAGLSPALPTDIVMVIRSMPIRVAGNSGPLPFETSWPFLAKRINRRREECGMSPIVSADDIRAFEDAVRAVAQEFYAGSLPAGSDGLDQHNWTNSDRERFRVALSELNKQALEQLPPDTITRLKALFEMTTVTKKLRRIADISFSELNRFALQVRPHRVVVTFMNYVTPTRWYTNDPVTGHEQSWLRTIEKECAAPVTLINRGPSNSHIVEVGH